MTGENWQKVRKVFDAALCQEPSERQNYIREACGDDQDLLTEVESLFSSFDNSDDFMETPAVAAVASMLASDRTTCETGTRIGRYEIIRQIGRGGTGEVFLAHDTSLGRKVALKLLPTIYTTDADRLRRFEQEARAASTLNHQNIVTIHEIGESNSVHFIATEFVDGQTLKEHMVNTPMTVGEVLDVASQVASALQAAHEAGIVHRDVKPENIMLRRDGFVKVLDFGLAKTLSGLSGPDEAQTKSQLTMPGVILGTVPYMSPEQLRGKPVDARTDVFSFGAVLYEMLSGRRAFARASDAETIGAILHERPPELSSVDSGIPKALEDVVGNCLAKDADERYQTMEQVARDLNAARSDELIAGGPATHTGKAEVGDPNGRVLSDAGTARKASGVGHLLSGVRRHRWGVMLAAAGAIILAAALGYYLYFAKGGEAIDSIAVLPFVNVGNDPNAEYLSDGISDSIINSLSQLPNLEDVASFSSVMRYKGKEIDPQAVGRELNVAAVLTGRLSLRGDEVLVSTELVDVKDNRRLWGGQYNRKLANVFTLQGEIAQQISERLRLKLSGAQKERLTKPSTENAEAYQLYLQGLYYWWKNTDEATLKSGEYFQQAIEKDPNFGLAHVGLADYYNIMAGFGNMRPNEALPKAEAAAVKALAIDERLFGAHRALGMVKIWYDWDWPGAERELKRAIELNPEGDPRGMYNRFLEMMGRIDEAIADASVNWNEPPGSRLARESRLPRLLFIAGRYGEALEAWRKTIEKGTTRREMAHLGMGEIYLKQERYEEALAEMLEVRPRIRYPRELARIGYVYAVAGKRDEAIKILEEMKGLTGERYNLGTHIAAIYAGLGNKDEALVWLKKACDEHEQGVVDLKVDPRFDTLRSDPRFIDLLRRVKLAP